VSDNASEDKTAEVLNEFSDQRLSVIRQVSNIGPSRNFNACLAAANGIYIVVVCDDDLVSPHLLERGSTFLSGDLDVPVIVALGDVVEGGTCGRRPATISRRLKSGVCDGIDILLEFLAGRISPHLCTVAMKTETLRANGGFPEDYPHTGDLASWVPLLLHGKAGFINESCGAYRDHEGTQTAMFSGSTRLNDIHRLASLITARAEKKVQDPQVLEVIRRETRRYVARHVIGQITMERRKGVSRRDCMVLAWKWRNHLLQFGPSYFLKVGKPLILFFLPLGISRLIRKMKRFRFGDHN
jgi:hypothetical protein